MSTSKFDLPAQKFLSVFDIFSIGLGPSSSHSTGPMRAAKCFTNELRATGDLANVSSITVQLYGSLALTGKGHGTDKAVVLGLLGEEPTSVDMDTVAVKINKVTSSGRLALAAGPEIVFDLEEHLVYLRRQFLSRHPNGIRFSACAATGTELHSATYYSVGGGFVINESGEDVARDSSECVQVPFPFYKGADLMEVASEQRLRISDIMLANECAFRSQTEIYAGIRELWQVMCECVQRGCNSEGLLPGGLNVRRRAPELFQQLSVKVNPEEQLTILDWVNVWAIAVNEENACGGRVVTAPTNGAAGIIPAVLHYLEHSAADFNEDMVVGFFLTATAIGILYKLNASISGADVGCQGEVGVACSMAAGALTEALGGTVRQVEMAAEIGMEHNLGLTCDPIGGLVQIPCIERNAMGAVKAINAARLALNSDGSHHVSLDRVIATMKRTGADMSSKYKETSRGGLAVNIPEC